MGLEKPYVDSFGQYPKLFFPETMLDVVVERILENRQAKMDRYPNYDLVVEKQKAKPDHTKSFWKNCKEIK